MSGVRLLCLALFCISILTFPLYASELSLRQQLEGLKVGSHEGGIYKLAGNTLLQFERARVAKSDIIKIDLRITRDGVPMVFHDETLNRWTWCSGLVRERTLQEVRDCRYKFTRYQIPTFQEALEWAAGRIVLAAEFKDPEVIDSAIKLVRSKSANHWVYFHAKSDRARYWRAHEDDPHAELLFAPRNQPSLDWALGLGDPNLLVIELHERILTAKNIAAIHQAGKLVSVNAWMNDFTYELFRAHCAPLFQQGVDIVISNRADSCVKQRDQQSLFIAGKRFPGT